MKILTYGTDPSQFIHWYIPKALPVYGTIVLVHGGFWRQVHNLSHMENLANALVAQGWAVANIEYRRADCGGDWPVILEDVVAAMQCVVAHAKEQGCAEKLVSIGHSVGGQLVLLAAQQMDAVIALAPVTDVVRTYEDNLGEGAAMAFFKESPEHARSMYQQASPIFQLPSGKPVLLVHGTADDRVPVEYAQDYVYKAKQAGDKISYIELNGVDHFQVIDPMLPVWKEHIQAWLKETTYKASN